MTTRVQIDPVRASDGDGLIAANLASIAYHEPWVYPCRDHVSFLAYCNSCDGRTKAGFIARERATHRIVGVVNVSEVVRGALQSAYLGYYGMAGFERSGFMREALALVLTRAFDEMGLHRLEANIQPANAPSRALARRLGFRLEGFSPRYLRIAGEWRDHERWALLADEWHPSARGP